MADLSKAGLEALEVLAANDPACGGKSVDGWKRRSQAEPIPRVNYIAAGKLCEAGLARRILPQHFHPFSHDDRYVITAAGWEALGE